MKTFILSDETVNSYGFRVLTAGINISDFEKNPVMLWNHGRSWTDNKNTILPIGHWENIRKENGKLLADANFDTDDEFAAKIARKVERGDIRGCSICFDACKESEDLTTILPGQTRKTISECHLMEVSICDIPSNKNSIVLMKGGKRIELTAGEECPIGLLTINNHKKMEENKELQEAQQEIARLKAENSTLQSEKATAETELNALKDEQAKRLAAEIDSLITAAIADGRINAPQKESMQKLFAADFEAAKTMLEGMKKPTSLSAMLQKGNGLGSLNWDELDKAGKLAELKAKDPEMFAELFEKKFGHRPEK